MQSLADALAAPIQSRIRFDTIVTSAAPGEIGLADGRRIEGSDVVLATPFDVTSRLLGAETAPGVWTAV